MFTAYAEGTALKVVMVAGQKSFAAEQASLSELRSVQFATDNELGKKQNKKNIRVPERSLSV